MMRQRDFQQRGLQGEQAIEPMIEPGLRELVPVPPGDNRPGPVLQLGRVADLQLQRESTAKQVELAPAQFFGGAWLESFTRFATSISFM
jgi:hypothetical protein